MVHLKLITQLSKNCFLLNLWSKFADVSILFYLYSLQEIPVLNYAAQSLL